MTTPELPVAADLIYVGEAADILAVSPATIVRWANEGVLTYFRAHPRGRRRFRREDILALLEPRHADA